MQTLNRLDINKDSIKDFRNSASRIRKLSVCVFSGNIVVLETSLICFFGLFEWQRPKMLLKESAAPSKTAFSVGFLPFAVIIGGKLENLAVAVVRRGRQGKEGGYYA